MALTLVEAAKQETGDEKRAAIIEMFARAHPLLQRIPIRGIQGNSYSYDQEGALPNVAFRGVNQGYSEDAGVLNPQTEKLTIAGGDLDVDKFIIDTQGMRQRAVREQMKVKNLAHMIAHKVIKGDSDTDPKEFDGWQKRVTGAQLIANGSTNGGDPLSMIKLDEAIHRVPDANALVMSQGMVRRLTQGAKSTSVSGFLSYDRDAFGNQVAMYNNLPIIEVDGPRMANQTLGFNEVGSTGSTATATSIYVAAFGEGQLEMIDNGGMQVRDLGELDTKPTYRTRVEWYVAQAIEDGYALARLYGISDAEPTK